jgi:dienelactone hydrolase
VFRIVLVSALSFSTLQAFAQETPLTEVKPQLEQVKLAKNLVAQMSAGEFDQAVESFDVTMKRVSPANKLQEAWNGVIKQYGSFKRTLQTRTEKVQQYDVVYVTSEFEKSTLDVKIVLSAKNEVAGLFFVSSYRAPSYVDSTKFEEKEIEFGDKRWRLPGTLSLPKGDGPFPAVILVHGSGPNDRDETIGPNKVFKDLAQGLASRGVAAFRYEKRTKHHQLAMFLVTSTLTVKEEVIDDAAAAVDALASQAKVDPKRIFVVGHSLGGMLLPRISKAHDGIAGLVSLAGSTRPMEDLVLEQTQYIVSLRETPSPEIEKAVKNIEKQVALVKSEELSKSTPATDLPLGIPASYWLDLKGYDPAAAAGELTKPMLILQGERDYQVTHVDFDGWKKGLASRGNVKFISYPKLNHLFIEGEGKSTPAEYSNVGNLSENVVDDIAKWILHGPK